jgi:hypothetical protein
MSGRETPNNTLPPVILATSGLGLETDLCHPETTPNELAKTFPQA